MKTKKLMTSILLIIFIIIIVTAVYYKCSVIFTQDKWFSNPQTRYKIVDNLIESYRIVGMTKNEVIDLLGNSDMGNEGTITNKLDRVQYSLSNSLVYYLGVDYVDSLWLVISYKNEIIHAVNICVT